jgi:membrane protein YqaA with SNARE-associated domain
MILAREIFIVLLAIWIGTTSGTIITYMICHKRTNRYKRQLNNERLANQTLENERNELRQRNVYLHTYLRGLQ